MLKRRINEEETFERVVSWIRNRAQKDNMPGIIVGVSGTDSLVVFLAAYKAFKELGYPERVTAVNFVHPANDEGGASSLEKNWFAHEIVPWLKKVAPEAQYVLDDTIPFSDDNKRWGNIFSRAISDTNLNHGMLGNYQLVAGTRNKTESVLGTYTLISRSPSLQPIEHLYKSEILDICDYLQVPQIALDKSREVDCDCGRFDVQADYLDELDLYIMVQQGSLDKQVLREMDPNILNAVREFYTEECANNAFRKQVPYRPTPTKTVYAGADIKTALNQASKPSRKTKAISLVTPRIIIDKDTHKAHQLLTTGDGDYNHWSAEALTLMGTQNLSQAKKENMAHAYFGADIKSLGNQLDILMSLSGKIGQRGFSFPTKRFTTQRFDNGPSLIERAGFTRLERETDFRDKALPPYNPDRDELGTGFMWRDDNWYIEQRRSYLLFSSLSADKPVTLIIRNSSPFFGRDRLKDTAYVSFDRKTEDELLALDATILEQDQSFIPWQEIAKERVLSEKLERAAYALDMLDNIDFKFSQWLRTSNDPVRFRSDETSLNAMFNDAGGLIHLRALLKESLLKHVSAEKPGAPLFLSQLDPEHSAPWQPHRICPVTTDMLSQLKAFNEKGLIIQDQKLHELMHPFKKRPLILMSGPYGDFPV